MYNGWWYKRDGYNPYPEPDEMPTWQSATEYLRQLLQILLVMIRPRSYPLLSIRYRISNGQIENWDGCDAFSDFLSHRYSFYLATGETSESLLRLTRATRHLFLNQTGRNYTILPVNRVMLYMMWLRFYPSYHNLALIFNVSLATVHNEINESILIIKRALERVMQWPTINE
jgi:hypothetical protein